MGNEQLLGHTYISNIVEKVSRFLDPSKREDKFFLFEASRVYGSLCILG